MPDMLSRDEIEAIRRRHDDPRGRSYEAFALRSEKFKLLAHIDALTAAVRALNEKARLDYEQSDNSIDFHDGEFAAYSTVLAIIGEPHDADTLHG